MRIARIVGARPQFMQVPSIMRLLEEAGHEHILVHTGQHYDHALSGSFFADLGLPAPAYNLEVGSGRHGEATGRMIERIERVLLEIKPGVVLVDGDTNSTLGAALAAVKLHIPLAHIEAGVRDFDRRRPEEINRVLTDHASDLNFAPVPRALDNLKKENLGARSMLTGDVLLDCFLEHSGRREGFRGPLLQSLRLEPGGYHVITLHRPENTDLDEYGRFAEIISFVAALDKPAVLPLHPRTKAALDRYRAAFGSLGAIKVIPPASYLELLALVDACDCVFTDSGGLSREAVWAGRRCVMLLHAVTWHDLLEQGWAQIGATDRASIAKAFERAKIPEGAAAHAFFGGGKAAQAIVAGLERTFG